MNTGSPPGSGLTVRGPTVAESPLIENRTSPMFSLVAKLNSLNDSGFVALIVIGRLKSVNPIGPMILAPPGVLLITWLIGVNAGIVSGPVQFATVHV